jgi:hypothetical protein
MESESTKIDKDRKDLTDHPSWLWELADPTDMLECYANVKTDFKSMFKHKCI